MKKFLRTMWRKLFGTPQPDADEVQRRWKQAYYETPEYMRVTQSGYVRVICNNRMIGEEPRE